MVSNVLSVVYSVGAAGKEVDSLINLLYWRIMLGCCWLVDEFSVSLSESESSECSSVQIESAIKAGR